MPHEISDANYIVRYCRPKTIINNQITSAAFKLRDDEKYISMNWIPKNIDINVGLAQVMSTLARKKLYVTQKGRFVIFSPGIIKSYVYDTTKIKLSICHKFSSNDPTYVSLLPINSNNTDDLKKFMYDAAVALSEFTQMHPEAVFPVFGDKNS